MPQFLLDLLSLPPEGSTAAFGIDALHLFVISITMMSSFGVFLVAVYFVVRYRRKHEGQLTEIVVGSTKSELTIIGGILVALPPLVGHRIPPVRRGSGRLHRANAIDGLRDGQAMDVEVHLHGWPAARPSVLTVPGGSPREVSS
jgi:heme/copper-type cytochrome/quinol oxidase subunit 2